MASATAEVFNDVNQLVGKGKACAKSILPDMVNMKFPEDIKIKANNIYLAMTKPTRRSEKRKMMIFYCIYNAYKEIGIPEDPRNIASTIGIKPTLITKATSLFSNSQTGYEPPNKFHRPNEYLSKICEELGISEQRLPEIDDLTNRVLDNDPGLLEEKPQKLAAAIINYWLACSGITLDKETKMKSAKQSIATIDTLIKKISIADNSCASVSKPKIEKKKITIIIKSAKEKSESAVSIVLKK
ncbi:MAG: TFIIB transcription initiation factor [Solumvirus sp.]|uniref:TFIIB transcription initiation factor n=1 Tax=Solumvirus sp. TaxID=2487773 RepID=A0A3G5AG59_9VIRU|nr:MAG: TFIIB transcription initiation factor [Solumvirus sp.]